MGAVNKAGNVDLDTGAVLFGSALLQALFRLISTGGKVDEKKFRQFCNEEARISFYGDFLYPLANDSTLEDFYKEAAEGQLNEALHECRTQIWKCDPSFLNEAVVSVTGGIYSFRNNKGIEKSCNKRCAGLRVPGLEDAGEFSGCKKKDLQRIMLM